MTLREKIAAEIERAGPISFARYMEMCLYDPELGYYSRHAEQFGKAGDFYTASDVHAVFGRLLARQFAEMWCALGSPRLFRICELGAGRGLFARDVLDWSQKKFPEFFAALEYVCVERSSRLRERIAASLGPQLTARKASTTDSLPEETADAGIVFANEFFDALPVEVLAAAGQLMIGAQNGRMIEQFKSPHPAVLELIDRYSVHPEAGERVEAGLVAQQMMTKAAAALSRGFVIVVDYGYTREEQLAGRHRGTVTAIRQHAVSATPYEGPGEQDITAHVNFTALEAAGREAGLSPLGLVTQAQLLMGIGEANQFADAFEDTGSRQEQAKVALQLKHLVTPAGMGESFHALVMGKRAGREGLSGLAFAR
jgi:SAM-dependent MidA family methyltransferase